MKNKFYLKIVFVFFLSFIVSSFLIKEVFLGESPVLRSNLLSHLSLKLADLARIESKRLISLFKKPANLKQELKEAPFDMITKGVYGKAKGNYSYTEVRLNEIEWVEYTFDIKDKKIKIKFPKGQTPPTQQMVEEIYK